MKYFYQFLVITFILSSCSPKVTTVITGWDYNGPKMRQLYKELEEFEKDMDKFCKKEGFNFIVGGTLRLKENEEIVFNSEQKNALYRHHEGGYIHGRVTVSSFYMSDHEVTNKEYRKFVNWVKSNNNTKHNQSKKFIYQPEKFHDTLYMDSTSYSDTINTPFEYHKTFLSQLNYVFGPAKEINILPDTNIWLNSKFYDSKDTLHSFYFSHPHYDNYPVVGVTQKQALAYCLWLTVRYAEDYRDDKDGRILVPPLRLPTEMEYRLASQLEDYLEKSNNSKSLKDKNGRYIANFGEVKDNNNIVLKGFLENELKDRYTTPVKTFEPNAFGIYDIQGNVEEWTSDRAYSPFTDTYLDEFIAKKYGYNRFEDSTSERGFSLYDLAIDSSAINQNLFNYRLNIYDNIESAPQKYLFLRDSLDGKWVNSNWKDKIELRAKRDLHNLKALHKLQNPTLAIGGSWADNQAILLYNFIKVYENNESSSTLGFRCVFDMVGSPSSLPRRRFR